MLTEQHSAMLNLTESVVRDLIASCWSSLYLEEEHVFHIGFLTYSSAVNTSSNYDLSETLGFSSQCFYMNFSFSALKSRIRETAHSRNLKYAFSETYLKTLMPC